MRRKIIISLSIIFFIIMCNHNITSAVENTSKVKLSGNIDAEKNITLNIKTRDIRIFEGMIDYDADVLEYVGIEGKNNWKVSMQGLNITAISENSDNLEMLDVLGIKFKLKNSDDIIDTNLSIIEIKIVKDDNTRIDLDDLDTTITINKDESNINDDEIAQEEEEIDDTDIDGGIEENNEDDETIEEDDDVFAAEQTKDNPSENDVPLIVKSSENIEYDDEFEEKVEEKVAEKIEEKKDDKKIDETSKNVDNSISVKENVKEETLKEAQKDNLANNKIPQTGVIITIIPFLIIIFSVSIAYFSYKKYKR